MKNLLTLGQMLSAHARLAPARPGARDLERSLTFAQWNERACRLANAFLGMGLVKGDRVAVLAYNCVEWCEIYAATAKAGLVAVPVNFRLSGREITYIVGDAGAKAMIVQESLFGVVEAERDRLPFPLGNLIHFGAASCPAGVTSFEGIIAAAAGTEPPVPVHPDDPWMLMYTSGTTGNPKGVVRSHRGSAMLALVTEIELGIRREDNALLVMPMCHANSLYFFGSFSYRGAAVTIYSRQNFDAEHAVATLADSGATFTSLVPTHYVMMLDLPAAVRARHDLDRVTRLMISSAPARPDTKRAAMEMFRNSGLFELYGATETGWVTMLHPSEQFSKLGSVGRECAGSAPIRLLDDDGNEVPDGQAGELFSATPYTFDGYWNLPEKTRAAFRGEHCSVGDMARRDGDGFIVLVDRKSNMIISGGENIYPSEVEAFLATHAGVKDVAVIGLPDEKWGERVHAVVVPRSGAALTELDLQEWCRRGLAGFKRPRSFAFVRDDEMPRNATGKILHRELKTRYAS